MTAATPAEIERLERELKDAKEMEKHVEAHEKALAAYRANKTPANHKKYREASAALTDHRSKWRLREIDAGRRPLGHGVHVGKERKA